MLTPLTHYHRLALAFAVCCMPLSAAAKTVVIPVESAPVTVAEWQPHSGDSFIVDTQENMGYLLHPEGGFTQFPVATGQQRVVWYLKRSYNASTPNKEWTVLKEDTQTDRVTFGKDGRFLRLTDDKNNYSTPYGIHSHLYIERMLASPSRYFSLGCILVSEDMLTTIIKTFHINGNRLNVVTVDGFGEAMTVTESMLKQAVSSKKYIVAK